MFVVAIVCLAEECGRECYIITHSRLHWLREFTTDSLSTCARHQIVDLNKIDQ